VLPVALGLFGAATQTERVLGILRWPLLLLAVMLALALVYRFGPSRRVAQWRWVSWGSVVAAVLCISASMLFSWYVASFDSYNRIYGSLGTGIGFVTWMWLSAVVVLIGAELNAETDTRPRGTPRRGRRSRLERGEPWSRIPWVRRRTERPPPRGCVGRNPFRVAMPCATQR
jgi:membrane protein